MNAMFLVLGDWYSNVSFNYERILVLSNKTVIEIQNAYKTSCKLTGVSFHRSNDPSDQKEAYDHFIATDRDQGFEVSDETKQALNLHGYNFDEHLAFGFNEDNMQVKLNSAIFLHLWTEFVKLSLPDLIITAYDGTTAIPVINGYWDDELNVYFARGLY